MKKYLSILLIIATSAVAENDALLTKHGTNEVSLVAGFVPDSARIMLGEPTFLTFTVSNVAAQPFHFSHVRNEIFSITATNNHGMAVKSRYFGLDGNGFVAQVTVLPGQAYARRLFLNDRCDFEQPGEYSVTCRAELHDYMDRSNSLAQSVVTLFKLTVLPADPQRLTEIIQAWGQTIRTNGAVHEAAQALAEINDPRTIPHLALLMTNGFDPGYIAVTALARFSNSLAAADALTAACQNGDDFVAQTAGAALRNMKQADRAARTLLPALNNPEANVRVAGTRSVSWTGAELAFDPLCALLRDESNSVRYAAAEAVGRLGSRRSLAALTNCLGNPDFAFRIAAVKGLIALKQPLQAAWLTPIILAGGENIRTYYDAIDLLRMYGEDQAAPGLAGCLHFDDPSVKHSYNFRLVLALEYSPRGPQYYYQWHHDPNRDGSAQELAENRRILAELKAWLEHRK